MTTPDLTPTMRSALDKVLDDPTHLTVDERTALAALRDACPDPRWLPTEDGIAVCTDRDGDRAIYYVRGGRVGTFLRPDGTLLYPGDPAAYSGTWEPYVHEVTAEQIAAAAGRWYHVAVIRAALPALGCREVTR